MNEIKSFIIKCTKEGKDTPESICEAANQRIEEINKIIYAADKLRPEKSNLQAVLKSFGFESPKSLRKHVPIISEDSTQDDLDPKMLDLVIKICKILSEKVATNRQLMEHCNITADQDFLVTEATKWLGRNGIIVRANDNISYTRGPNWEARPNE